jgi:[ribosomal protein S5]-alanine N-acetyltransferase
MQLPTERLLLRDFTGAEWPEVLAYQRDPRYLRFYPWTERSEADVQAFVERFVGWQQETPRIRFQLAITLPDTGEVIGNVGVRRSSMEDRAGDMGFELSPEHWGRGYATEAAAAMLGFGFTTMGLHRIGADCIADNEASARVLERVGMRREGRLREAEHYKDRWWDVLMYGILEREWRAAGTPPEQEQSAARG